MLWFLLQLGWHPFICCQDIKEYFLITNDIRNRGGEHLVVPSNPVLQVAFPFVHLTKDPFSDATRAGIHVHNMANMRSVVARWRRELHIEEYESLVNLVKIQMQLHLQLLPSIFQTSIRHQILQKKPRMELH